MKTLFEKIIDREIPAEILHEDEDCIAVRDIVAPSSSSCSDHSQKIDSKGCPGWRRRRTAFGQALAHSPYDC